MFRLPVIDTGDAELDDALAALLVAATSVKPCYITSSQARSLLRLIANTESDDEDTAVDALMYLGEAGRALQNEFFRETS